jgi:multicomponent K+:H+ antiporter subunit E
MKPRWLAHPLLSALLAASWLLLQQSVAPGNLITAAVLGLVLPRLLHGFVGAPTQVHSWRAAWRLLWVVLYDIVIANMAVARIVLSPSSNPQPAWLEVPLDIQHPVAITLFATIITTTPGTVSCVVDEQRRVIWVHALDCADAAGMVADMKLRYEAPLKEIFE